MKTTIVNIGKDFSRFPVGRYRSDGNSNGERFREDILRPLLARGDKVLIQLDDTLGYGSSFLEEVFGGLIRHGVTQEQFDSQITLVSDDDSLISEIRSYVVDARMT